MDESSRLMQTLTCRLPFRSVFETLDWPAGLLLFFCCGESATLFSDIFVSSLCEDLLG